MRIEETRVIAVISTVKTDKHINRLKKENNFSLKILIQYVTRMKLRWLLTKLLLTLSHMTKWLTLGRNLN